MSEKYFYNHVCKNCQGRGVMPCEVCAGSGIMPKYLGFVSVTCPACNGKKNNNNCAPCSNRGKIKVYRLPEIIADIKMDHTAEYYQSVVERLQKAVYMVIDSVNYHYITWKNEEIPLMNIDGSSTIELIPASVQAEAFTLNYRQRKDVNINSLKKRLRGEDHTIYTRFIGKLNKIEMLPTNMGCYYEVQCYYLHQVDMKKQNAEEK